MKGFFARWTTHCRGTSRPSTMRCPSRSTPCRSRRSAPDARRHAARHETQTRARRSGGGLAASGKARLAQGDGYLRAGRCARDRRKTAPHAGTACARRRHRCGFGLRSRSGGDIQATRHGHRPTVVRRPVVAVNYSKLDGRHLLESSIRLVALTAQYPGRSRRRCCIGRPKKAGPPKERLLGPPEAAVDVLRDLVAMYDAAAASRSRCR